MFPDAILLRCWNHLFKAMENWLSTVHGKKIDKVFYTDEIRDLIQADSQDHFERLFADKKTQWDPVFLEYFTKQILPDIEKSSKGGIKFPTDSTDFD